MATNTKTKILDAAEELTQSRGFNGFSYIDLSSVVGVKTSSIHYHFKSKADLGLALVERAREVHLGGLREMNGEVPTPRRRLTALIEFFQGYVREDRFCLCGMLTAELESASPEVRSALSAYFEELRAWVASQFREMGFKEAKRRALMFVSTLEGSALIARLEQDPSLVADAMKRQLKE